MREEEGEGEWMRGSERRDVILRAAVGGEVDVLGEGTSDDGGGMPSSISNKSFSF